jgi:hypothetical protein
VFSLPAAACGRHMVIIGASGPGKTNLMMRLWAGWLEAAWLSSDASSGPARFDIVVVRTRPA